MYGLMPNNENESLKKLKNFEVDELINHSARERTTCITPVANLELKLSSLAVSHIMVFSVKSSKDSQAMVVLLKRKPYDTHGL